MGRVTTTRQYFILFSSILLNLSLESMSCLSVTLGHITVSHLVLLRMGHRSEGTLIGASVYIFDPFPSLLVPRS
jgi:hypothetical protein